MATGLRIRRKVRRVVRAARRSGRALAGASFEDIEAGLKVGVLSEIARESGLSEARLKDLARISSSTFARRQKIGRFSPEESDRLARIRRVTAIVRQLFDGDRAAALHWLGQPDSALGDRRPVDLLVNDAGAVEVEGLINQIADGVFT